MHVEGNGKSFEGGGAEESAPWPDAALHVYREASHELLLVYRGVTERETRSVQFGQASFALIVEPPLIVLCYRFGDAIPWSVAPYRWHRVPYPEAELSLSAGAPSVVRVSLVEADDGQVIVNRTAPLSMGLTRAWNAAIRRQSGKTCSEARFSAALTQFSRRFPQADCLLPFAIATSVDGE